MAHIETPPGERANTSTDNSSSSNRRCAACSMPWHRTTQAAQGSALESICSECEDTMGKEREANMGKDKGYKFFVDVEIEDFIDSH